MEINKAYYQTKIGTIRISYGECIERIDLVDFKKEEGIKTELTEKIAKEIGDYLDQKRTSFDIYEKIFPKGTDFQKKVWQELIKIPYGQTRTYKDIAKAIDQPKAVRAVANAIGKNPLMIIIPCHRVIRSDGSLGGYAYGKELKNFFLNLEEN